MTQQRPAFGGLGGACHAADTVELDALEYDDLELRGPTRSADVAQADDASNGRAITPAPG